MNDEIYIETPHTMYGASENLILILITDTKVTALDRLIEALVESNPDILKSSGNRVASNDYTENIDTNPPDDQVSEDKDDDTSIDYQNISIDTSRDDKETDRNETNN